MKKYISFHNVSLIYLILPFVIFCVGYIRWYISIGLFVFIGWSLKNVIRKESDDTVDVKKQILFCLVSLLIALFIGVGGFWPQSSDWLAKNPILNDMSVCTWPIVINPSSMPEYIKDVVGDRPFALIYYFFYYIPAACIGQLWGVGAARLALYFWTAIGIYLILNLITDYCKGCVCKPTLKKYIFVVLLFVCWGGLDIIGHSLRLVYLYVSSINQEHSSLLATYDIECWCRDYFSMYSSNWSSLWWCFNQSIPVWIITALIVSAKENMFFYSSLTLLYSPWSAMTLVPMVVTVVLYNICKNINYLRGIINVQNVLFPLLLLIVAGSFYFSNSTSLASKGWFYEFETIDVFIPKYIAFILVEIGLYIFVLKKIVRNDIVLQLSFFVLLLLPFYKITDYNDLMSRGSIPVLFVVFLYWVKWCLANYQKKKLFIVVACFFTSLSALQVFVTSCLEMIRYKQPVTFCQDVYYSKLEDLQSAKTAEAQFFAHDFESTFFWKYLAQK